MNYKIKKRFLLITLLCLSILFTSCTAVIQKPSEDTKSNSPKNGEDANISSKDAKHKIDKLSLEFVPFMDSEIIVNGTKKLPELLKEMLLQKGFYIGEIKIGVGTSYSVTGEGMSAGSIDIAWLPESTYAVYADDVEVILSATRKGLSNDSEEASTWNGSSNATQKNGPDISYYRSLICTTPSTYGKELSKKLNSGEKLSVEDLKKAKWAIQSTTSASGHIYPALWLKENYGIKISELPNLTPIDSGYGTTFLMAAAEQVDIVVFYADARIDYAKAWNLPTDQKDEKGKQGMGRETGIWDEINVIGVSKPIYNPTISISKASKAYSPEFKKAFQEAILEIAATEEGKQIFMTFNHTGYAIATDVDYQGAKDALKAISE